MASLLSGIVDGVKALYGLAFPMFVGPSAAGAEEAHPARRWVARLILLTPALSLLWMLNRWETLGLRNWVTHGRLGEFWLPLLALFLYAALWLSWWLYLILRLDLEPMRSDFPDIDDAWDRVKKALAEADISIDATPLFLVLGASPETDAPFFRSTGLRMKVRPSESDAGEPVRAAANRDGIWVVASGAGSLSDLGDLAPSRDPADASLQSLAEGSTEAGTGRPADDFATVGIPQISERA
ncbi:MAG: hypothetical protein K2X91_12335, partial [Thermoleophilia bacterium]|nr:hypothetical protein [Thermoleophilia bacterium]